VKPFPAGRVLGSVCPTQAKVRLEWGTQHLFV